MDAKLVTKKAVYNVCLKDITPGVLAVDPQGTIFGCIFVTLFRETKTQIFKLGRMTSQYNDNINTGVYVRVLAPGEQVKLTV